MTAPRPLDGTESEPVTVADRVYQLLEGEILSGRIAGGSRLRVRQLADLASTSIMPVRDAIHRLERAGLALSEPNKGARVKEFNARELNDIYTVRLILEPEAAALGTALITDEAIIGMQTQLLRIEQAIDARNFSDAIDADSELLRTLYAATGNDFLCKTIDSLWKQSYLYRVTSISSETEHRTLSWNAKIVEAAERGDTEAVRAHSRASIDHAMQDLTAYIKTLDQLRGSSPGG